MRRDELRYLAGLYVISFLFRMIYLWICGMDYPYETQGWYESYARGNPFDCVTPVYPLILKGIFLLFGDSYTPAIIVQSLITSFTPVLVYLITKRLFRSTTAAVIAGGITTLLPEFILWNSFLKTEAIYTVIFLMTIYTTLKYFDNPSTLLIFNTFALAFIGMHTRRIMLFMYAVIWLFMLWKAISSKKISHALMLCLILAWLLLYLPQSKPFGNSLYGSGKNIFLTSANKWDSELHTTGNYSNYDLGVVHGQDLTIPVIIEGLIDRFYYFWAVSLPRFTLMQKFNNIMTLPALYLFACLGLIFRLRRRTLMIAGLILTTATFHTVTFIDYSYRYRFPIIPLLIILASYGAVKSWSAWLWPQIKELTQIYHKQVLNLIEEVEQSCNTQWRYSGCNRCGTISSLKKRKGKYQFVCDKCKKELDKRRQKKTFK